MEFAFLAGVIVGIVNVLGIIAFALHFKTPIARTLNQAVSVSREKGKILEPESEELQDLIASFKKND